MPRGLNLHRGPYHQGDLYVVCHGQRFIGATFIHTFCDRGNQYPLERQPRLWLAIIPTVQHLSIKGQSTIYVQRLALVNICTLCRHPCPGNRKDSMYPTWGRKCTGLGGTFFNVSRVRVVCTRLPRRGNGGRYSSFFLVTRLQYHQKYYSKRQPMYSHKYYHEYSHYDYQYSTTNTRDQAQHGQLSTVNARTNSFSFLYPTNDTGDIIIVWLHSTFFAGRACASFCFLSFLCGSIGVSLLFYRRVYGGSLGVIGVQHFRGFWVGGGPPFPLWAKRQR